MSKVGLRGRLAALEGVGGTPPSYVVYVEEGADAEEIDTAIEAHRLRTGHRGRVIVSPPEAPSVADWLSLYAPDGGAA